MVILVVLVVLVVLVGGYALLTYNRLVGLRLAVDNSWSQVDVALALRHDLVPNLVAAVQGYATHERTTLEGLTAARTEAVAAPSQPTVDLGKAESRLAQGIGQVMVIAEAYPDLRASDSFRQLQAQLGHVEDQIQVTRRVYNDVVERYATKIGTIPSLFVARAFGFGPREFFKAPVEAQAVPVVSLPPDA